ncbi:hypothetical protein [Pantoea sp. 18069]|uniref:hypothetical protein n=1 Tax=Pantoea sp. 18069 TaxID=2681415 RepID=UPI00135B6A41|nr:hypothetical protein [Pantoea sp. 18069]
MNQFKTGDRCEVFDTGTSGDGATLTILAKAPNREFTLPNGTKHSKPRTDDAYVVQLDEPVNVPMQFAGMPTNQFRSSCGVVSAAKMRLIERATP